MLVNCGGWPGVRPRLKKRSSREAERLGLMRSMLLYLVQHSDAMDTAEGILQWWLPLEQRSSREQLQRVLDELVDKKWLIARGSVEEFKLYGLNKEKLPEVLQFISENRENSGNRVQ
jgi:hypothetical protein